MPAVRAAWHQGTRSVTAMAIITAAIGGKKANKLISLLEKQQNRLFGDQGIFPDETQTRQYFQCRR